MCVAAPSIADGASDGTNAHHPIAQKPTERITTEQQQQNGIHYTRQREYYMHRKCQKPFSNLQPCGGCGERAIIGLATRYGSWVAMGNGMGVEEWRGWGECR